MYSVTHTGTGIGVAKPMLSGLMQPVAPSASTASPASRIMVRTRLMPNSPLPWSPAGPAHGAGAAGAAPS